MSRAGRAAGVLALAGCLVCCWVAGRSGGILEGRWGLFAVVAAWLGLSAAATGALRASSGPALVLVSALALQGLALTAGPQLSDDLYRYVWDARVAAGGVDPYRSPPDSSSLVRLREPDLWPTAAGCAANRTDLPNGARADPFARSRPPGCTPINRQGVRTIYPPAAQLAFRGAALLTRGVGPVELRAQLPAAATSVALTGLLVLLLRRARRPVAWALLYAASPLAGLEAGMDAHVDVLAALLGTGLVAVLASGRRPAVAGLLLSLATLVKLYPAALATVVAARWGWRSARTWLCAAAAVAVSVLLYLPHVLAVGPEVVGYLPGYLRENGYDTGTRYLLLGLLPMGAAPAVALAGLGALVVWSCLSRVPAELAAVAGRAATVLGGALLLLTPGNAWYCALLVCCALLAARPEWVLVVLANYTVYFAAVLGRGSGWPTAAYVLALACAGAGALLRRPRPVPA